MADPFTAEKRRDIMRAITPKDTKPELVVRRIAHSLGFRYRLHVRSLPGIPDLVFPRRRKVIFVHGCFWHRHRCARGRSTPTTRKAFWLQKFQNNVRRDRRHARQLARLGWRVLIVWECGTVPGKQKDLTQRILRFLKEKGSSRPRRSLKRGTRRR